MDRQNSGPNGSWNHLAFDRLTIKLPISVFVAKWKKEAPAGEAPAPAPTPHAPTNALRCTAPEM